MLGLCLLALLTVGQSVQADYEVRLNAGSFARAQSLIVFDCPDSIWNPELRFGGEVIPVQLGVDGRLYALIEGLNAGEVRNFKLANRESPSVSNDGVWVARAGDQYRFELNGRSVVQYQAGPSELPRTGIDPLFQRGGYLHPVWSPSGRVITDDYPANHLHHHGIWVSWTKTEFDLRQPNFWEMGSGKGTVEFVAVDHYWSGPVFGGLRSRHRFVDLTAPDPVVVLNETWELKVYALTLKDARFHVFDLRFAQSAATDKALKLPKYRYGGLGFRGHHDWDGEENASFLTGLGEGDRVKGHATRAPWCYVGGLVEGAKSGVAILCHPENFRAPQPMRIHPKEPFFCYAPAQIGNWEIAPGKPYDVAYRFVVFDGEPDQSVIDQVWKDYAEPVQVSVEKR